MTQAETKLLGYYNKTSDAYYAATLLNHQLKIQCNKLGTDGGHVSTRSVREAMHWVMKQFEDSHPLLQERANQAHSRVKTKMKKGGIADVLRQMRSRAPNTLENKLKTYLAAPLADEECDILQVVVRE